MPKAKPDTMHVIIRNVPIIEVETLKQVALDNRTSLNTLYLQIIAANAAAAKREG